MSVPEFADDMPRQADVIVVGSGVAGASDAFHIGRYGLDVVVVDGSDQPASLTTGRSVAAFRGQWDIPDYAALVLESIEFYENFAAETGLEGWDIGLRQRGWLFVVGTADGMQRCERFIDGNRRLGVLDSEVLDRDEVLKRFPWVSESVTAATFRARDGWLSPYEVVTGLLRASQARVVLRAPVEQILVERGAVAGVRTPRGDIRAPRVVIACGPFSGEVASTAGVSLPVLPIRRQLAFVRDCPDVPIDAPMFVDADTHAYWRPEGSGALLSVTRAEDPGPPLREPRPDWDYAAQALEANTRMTPFWADVAASLSSERITTIAGQYTCTSDGRPLIGALPQVRGLFCHTGDNGWGVESAPAAGRTLAQAVVLGEPDTTGPYSPGRRLVERKRRLASNWP